MAVGGELPSPALHLGDNCAEGVNRFWAWTPATACLGPCSLATSSVALEGPGAFGWLGAPPEEERSGPCKCHLAVVIRGFQQACKL